jgi:perosamine synthetase
MIPLSNPDISEAEIEAVVRVLRSSRLSLGPKLAEFEQAIAEYVGSRHAVAVSSGTAGLHLALLAYEIGPDAEVILPSFAFVAAANAIRYVGATPVFADIDPTTLNLDPVAVENAITPRTRAIMAVHTFGRPSHLGPLLDIAQRHRLVLIEDACEALGAQYHGRRVGAIGDIGVFSFYPNKPITTGEGGVVVVNDSAIAATLRALRNQGRTDLDDWLHHSLLGYNYRLPEINCALGVEQLKRLEGILAHRQLLAHRYCELLQSTSPEVETPLPVLANSRISWFAFVVKLPVTAPRDLVMKQLSDQGIASRAYFPAIHRMPLYASYVRHSNPLKVTEEASSRTLALPFFNGLQEYELQQVCQTLRQVLDSLS